MCLSPRHAIPFKYLSLSSSLYYISLKALSFFSIFAFSFLTLESLFLCITEPHSLSSTCINLRKTSFSVYSQSHLGWHFRMLFQSSKLKARTSLFLLKRGKRDVRALSFELSKMSPEVGLAVFQLTEDYSIICQQTQGIVSRYMLFEWVIKTRLY